MISKAIALLLSSSHALKTTQMGFTRQQNSSHSGESQGQCLRLGFNENQSSQNLAQLTDENDQPAEDENYNSQFLDQTEQQDDDNSGGQIDDG